MGVKYSVSVGVNKFEFKDGTTSIGIAELLVNSFVPSEYHKELTVLIEVEKADDETQENEEDEQCFTKTKSENH